MRNLQAQTIFFSATSTQTIFFFRQRFLQTIFFSLRNAMLYYEEFYVTTLVLPLTCSLLNNIDGPVFTLFLCSCARAFLLPSHFRF